MGFGEITVAINRQGKIMTEVFFASFAVVGKLTLFGGLL